VEVKEKELAVNPLPDKSAAAIDLFLCSGMTSAPLNQMWPNPRRIPSGTQRLISRTSQGKNSWTKQSK